MSNQPRLRTKLDAALEAVHLSHCYQDEYAGSCKYGADDCPAKSATTVEQPSRMAVNDLALIRRVILEVIDDGWKCSEACDIKHPWAFNSADDGIQRNTEDFDDARRLDFCDAVQRRLVEGLK